MKTGMEGPDYPDGKTVEAFYRAIEQQQRHVAQRAREHPNKARPGELIFAAVVVIVCTIASLLFLIWLGAIVWIWFEAKPQWLKAACVVVAAFSLGLLAYGVREAAQSKLYPVAELIFGAGLSAWGVQTDNKVAAAIAFIQAVRLIIDGYKRFFERRSYRLFSVSRIRYNWRNFNRWARSFSYS